MFVRVRYADPGAPGHEFDVPVNAVERFAGRYVVVDEVPVEKPRPPAYNVRKRKSKRPQVAE